MKDKEPNRPDHRPKSWPLYHQVFGVLLGFAVLVSSPSLAKETSAERQARKQAVRAYRREHLRQSAADFRRAFGILARATIVGAARFGDGYSRTYMNTAPIYYQMQSAQALQNLSLQSRMQSYQSAPVNSFPIPAGVPVAMPSVINTHTYTGNWGGGYHTLNTNTVGNTTFVNGW